MKKPVRIRTARQLRRVTDVAQARTHRAREALGGKDAWRMLTFPAIQHDNHAKERQRIQDEIFARAHQSDDQAAESGTDGAREIEIDAAERDRGGQFFAGHDLRDDRLPGRCIERRANTQRETQDQQQATASSCA